MKSLSLQLKKKSRRFSELGTILIVFAFNTAALLTANASSSLRQDYPLLSAMTLSEQKKKELFLKIRANPIVVSMPVTASQSVLAPQSRLRAHHSANNKESAFVATTPSLDFRSNRQRAKLIASVSSSGSPLRSKNRSGAKGNLCIETASAAHDAITSSLHQQPRQTTDKHSPSSGRYRYLIPVTRQAINQAPIKRSRWKYIIIHNSGTRQGNARAFDAYHRKARRMKNGLAYHFVIGNGRPSGNGQIEIGNRWRKQINGGHVASDYLNNIAIGICLVGDFNCHAPTPQQLVALEELISYLQTRLGHVQRRQIIVLGHLEANSRSTDCPGQRFPLRWLHRRFPNK